MTTIAQGASATINIPAGYTLETTGAATLTYGPGRLAGQPQALIDSASVGPFSSAQIVYLTAGPSFDFHINNPEGAVNITLAAGKITAVMLQEGEALSITGLTGAVGVASLPGTLTTWAIGTGALAQIGPYAGTQRVLVTCSVGSVEATVGDAVLSVPQVTIDANGNPAGLATPGGAVYSGLATPDGTLGKNLPTASLGTKIANIASGTITFNAASAKVFSPLVGGAAVKLNTAGNFDLTNINYITPTTQPIVVGFWAFKPKNSPRSTVRVFISKNSGLTAYSAVDVCVEPGLNFYALPASNGVATGGGIAPGDTIALIRFRDLALGTYPALVAPDSILIGDVYFGHKPKAVWVWGFDDCRAEIFNASGAGTEMIGGNGILQLHSPASFLKSYGWAGTTYAIGAAIGATIGSYSFMTPAQLRSLQDDFGWTVGCHTFSHPNDSDVAGANTYGLRLLGPTGYATSQLSANKTFLAAYTGDYVTARNDSTGIRDNIETCMAVLESLGITGYKHMNPPQSVTDFWVDEAMRACGVKTCRGPNLQYLFAAASGAISGGVGANSQVQTALFDIISSVSLDSAGVSDATILTYIDNVIAHGAVGASQHHDWSTLTRGKFKLVADYLKTREQAGLISILTAEEFHKQKNKSLRMF